MMTAEIPAKMRALVSACGVVGGALALIASVVALLNGDADTAVVGAWSRLRQRCSGSSGAWWRATGQVWLRC